MGIHLQRDLDALDNDLLSLGAGVEDAILDAIRALLDRDLRRAQVVVTGHVLVAEEKNRVDLECLKMLALHQPLAGDLRHILAALKASVDLVRMGDLAEEIAERAQQLIQQPAVPPPVQLEPLARRATTRVRQALEAFARRDPILARRVLVAESETEGLIAELSEELVESMRQNPQQVPQGLALFSVVRHLKRVADYTTNIAENVLFVFKGEVARHVNAREDVD
jgi:phosphate transport system protein